MNNRELAAFLLGEKDTTKVPDAPPRAERRYGMSDEDVALYQGMSYGTPHEPFLMGALKYGPDDASLGLGSTLIPTEQNPGDKHRYAATYQASLRNPILALGLDFSKLGAAGPNAGIRYKNMPVHGLYSPHGDFALSDGSGNAGVDSHELMHRGFVRLAPEVPADSEIRRYLNSAPAPYEHLLMAQQQYNDDAEYRRRYEDNQALSTAKWGQRQSSKSVDDQQRMIAPRDGDMSRRHLEVLQRLAAELQYNRKPFGGPR